MALKFELDPKGVRQLLQSDEAREVCEDAAKQALQTLGDGYGSDARTGKNRVIVEISPKTPKAYYENKRHNTVLKAVGGVEL